MNKKYRKLVRDNIPEIIRANGEVPVTRVLDKKEYQEELIKKLHSRIRMPDNSTYNNNL